jgi:hypothetical protein
MSTTPVLETRRLCLREWREGDLEGFAAMNADREVMRHFPAALTREQSDAFVERIRGTFVERGFGLWAERSARARTSLASSGWKFPASLPHSCPVSKWAGASPESSGGKVTHRRAPSQPWLTALARLGSRKSCPSRPRGTLLRGA